MAIADLDGDGRIDVVQSQGEHATAVQERIALGTGLEVDRAPPVVANAVSTAASNGQLVQARVHDRKSPLLGAEWRAVEVRWTLDGVADRTPMQWYGEYLWRADAPNAADNIEVCATDAAGNATCAPVPPSS